MGPAARLGDERRHRGTGQLRQVVERPHGADALDSARAPDRADAGVRVRTPHEAEVQQPGQRQVVEIVPLSGDEAAVFLALERGADEHRLDAPRGLAEVLVAARLQ